MFHESAATTTCTRSESQAATTTRSPVTSMFPERLSLTTSPGPKKVHGGSFVKDFSQCSQCPKRAPNSRHCLSTEDDSCAPYCIHLGPTLYQHQKLAKSMYSERHLRADFPKICVQQQYAKYTTSSALLKRTRHIWASWSETLHGKKPPHCPPGDIQSSVAGPSWPRMVQRLPNEGQPHFTRVQGPYMSLERRALALDTPNTALVIPQCIPKAHN